MAVNIIDADHPFVIERVLRIPEPKLAVNESVEFEELEKRGGKKYLKGSDTPYTGKSFLRYENGQKRWEANFKDGLANGLRESWRH